MDLISWMYAVEFAECKSYLDATEMDHSALDHNILFG